MKKTTKILIAALLVLLAIALLLPALAGTDVPALLSQMDPQNLAEGDTRMLRARDRVTDALAENDRAKVVRALERYTDGFGNRMELGGSVGLQLFAYRTGLSLAALGLFLLIAAAAVVATIYAKKDWQVKAAIRLSAVASLFAVLFIIENQAGADSMLVTVLKKGAIYALIAVSMNLLNGFTGLFSLGQAGFMLIGAYTYAILTIPAEFRTQVYEYFSGGLVQFALPVLPGIIAAGLVAAGFAFLIGLPVLRLKSDYLAIATLGFAEIIRAVFQYSGLGPLTNGSNLLRRFPSFTTILFPFAVAGVCVALIALLIHSTYGRAFKAIRDDEVAAEAMGVNLYRHKQTAFTISSFFAGVGGALLAMYQTTVQASSFTSAMTYEILLIVVIGGMGSLSGSVMAAFLFVASSEWWLRFMDNEQTVAGIQVPLLRSGFRMVFFSVVIMAVVLFWRRGIMGDRELSLTGLFRRFRRKENRHGA